MKTIKQVQQMTVTAIKAIITADLATKISEVEDVIENAAAAGKFQIEINMDYIPELRQQVIRRFQKGGYHIKQTYTTVYLFNWNLK